MSDWTEALGKYKGKTVAVYGLGKAAEEVAKQLKGQFFIAGLLDSFRESGSLYGYDILDRSVYVPTVSPLPFLICTSARFSSVSFCQIIASWRPSLDG